MPEGRWPANVLFSHSYECELVGTKRVKGSHSGIYRRPDAEAAEDDGLIYGKMESRKQGFKVDFNDPDGKEEVEEWICVDGCPVKALGEQSGEGGGGKFKQSGERNPRGLPVYGGGPPTTKRHSPDNYGDSGTAARFFQTFPGKDKHSLPVERAEAKVLVGDCLERLKELPDDSIDSVITDPPYGLSKEPDIAEVMRHWLEGDDYLHNSKGFMGKSWDSFVPGPRYWKEVYRVMKPGAHLLCFSGTRTWDLMSMAIRFAGFENRDTIRHDSGPPALGWVYGSGFPKSLNVEKAIDKLNGKPSPPPDFQAWLAAAIKQRYDSHRLLALEMGVDESLIRHWIGKSGSQHEYPTLEKFHVLKEKLELDDSFDHLIEWAEAERELVGKSDELLGRKSGIGNAVNGHYTVGGTKAEAYDITTAATDEAKKWSGWGTSLKPSWEVILVFRKPLSESSVARNILKYGTGALNIDASRVGNGGHLTWEMPRDMGYHGGTDNGKVEAQQATSGRWPANLLLSHSSGCQRVGVRRVKKPGGDGEASKTRKVTEKNCYGEYDYEAQDRVSHYSPDGTEQVEEFDCARDKEGNYICPVALLDQQGKAAGVHGAGNKKTTPTTTGDSLYKGGWQSGMGNPDYYKSDGGSNCSRFFQSFHEPDTGAGFKYCAKSSRRERNAGLEGMPEKEGGGYANGVGMPGRTFKDGEWVQTGTWQEPNRKPRANDHPTVKPIALMSYLVKMVTPPGGTVLDPFCGSGSTGCAAVQEGFNFIGIEQDESYAEIARRRILHWSLPEEERAKQKAPKKARNTYGFKSTDVLRRCPEHNESIPSGSTTYKCGCEKVWYKVEPQEESVADALF